jgi:16S rRNA (guanine1516-N2)-methyltransferase
VNLRFAAAPRVSAQPVGLLCDEPTLGDEARVLAAKLCVPLLDESTHPGGLVLALMLGHLELRDTRDPRVGPVYADHTHLDLRPLSHRQPLARAFGKRVHHVVDATAGYAQDALLLSLMGFQVTAIERNPVVAALACDGLRRFEKQSGRAIAGRLRLLRGDARKLLPALAPRPDAVYLDPMFSINRKRSAAVRKEMRLLRELVGDDLDAVELLAVARAVAGDRVVVKRADDAPPLALGPDASICSKLVRYDIYLTGNR